MQPSHMQMEELEGEARAVVAVAAEVVVIRAGSKVAIKPANKAGSTSG